MHLLIVGEGAGQCAHQLRAAALEPITCRDVAEALDLHARRPVELVLVPVRSDPPSALLLRMLCSVGSPLRGRVVAALPEDGSVDPADALAQGADDVIGSPVQLGDLRRRCAVLRSRRSATERHARELLQLSEIVRTQQEALRSPLDLTELKQLMVVRCRALVGAQDAVLIQPVGPDLVRFEAADGRLEPLSGQTFERVRTVAELVMKTGEALRSDDVTHDSRFEAARYRQFNIRSVIAVPIRTVGEWGAAVAVASSEVGAFDDGDERALRLLCGTMEAAIEAAAEEERKQALYLELLETSKEREAALDRLRRSEGSFRALIENAPEAIFVYRDGQIVFCNQSGAQMIGACSADDLVARDLLLAIHPDDAGRVRAALEDALVRPLTRFSLRFYRRDGALRMGESVGLPIEFDGKPSGLIFSRDVTDQLELQRRMLLTDRLVSVGTLAAGVAHEINNPLAWVISGLSYVLEELEPLADRLPQPQATEILTALGDAREGAERVRTIVRDLKTFSRGDESRQAMVDLTSVLEMSIKMAWNEIRHRARLVRELAPVPKVAGNEVRLGQVFVNLLVNAAQAIPLGNVEAHAITVRTRAEEGQVVIEISDTGEGIPESLRSRIFDPFFTTKPVGEGTGLGLSICHGIITEAGGTIELESTQGCGSTFRIRLPAARAS